MNTLTADEAAELLEKQPRRGRPADPTHPMAYLRRVLDELGTELPIYPEELLLVVREQPGWGVALDHRSLEYKRLRDNKLRSMSARAIAERSNDDGTRRYWGTEDPESGDVMYTDPETGDLEHLVIHLLAREVTDGTRAENYSRLRNIAEQRAIQEGTTFEELRSTLESRINEKRGLVGVKVVSGEE